MNRLQFILTFLLGLLLNIGISASDEMAPFVSRDKWERHAQSYNYNERYKIKETKEKNVSHNKQQTNNRRKIVDDNISSPALPFFTGMTGIAYLFIAIVVIALGMVIIALIIGLFRKQPEVIPTLAKQTNIGGNYENIENADLEHDLKQVLALGKYKEAIRIKYLILLRLLNKNKMVIWKKDKTNGSYLKEMYGKKDFDIFRKVTILFEKIWYGETSIDEREYSRIIPVFDQIQSSIESRE